MDSNFFLIQKYPVDHGFGYVHDEETNRLYVAGVLKDGKWHDKFYEMEPTVKDDGSACLRILRTLDLPHGGICGCVCVLLHNKVFIIGGHGSVVNPRDVYSFDRETGRWQKEASMKEGRQCPSAVLTEGVGTTILVSGGYGSFTFLDSCEECNDSTKLWTVLPSRLNQSRCRHVSICHENRVPCCWSIGVGGSLLQGFEKVLTGIVDFGDPMHTYFK